ncbi:MAG: hypothetical protein WCD11_08740 [Solirubrobacteraceae bacterium]
MSLAAGDLLAARIEEVCAVRSKGSVSKAVRSSVIFHRQLQVLAAIAVAAVGCTLMKGRRPGDRRELKAAGESQQEWFKNLIQSQARLQPQIAGSATSRVRGLWKCSPSSRRHDWGAPVGFHRCSSHARRKIDHERFVVIPAGTFTKPQLGAA